MIDNDSNDLKEEYGNTLEENSDNTLEETDDSAPEEDDGNLSTLKASNAAESIEYDMLLFNANDTANSNQYDLLTSNNMSTAKTIDQGQCDKFNNNNEATPNDEAYTQPNEEPLARRGVKQKREVASKTRTL